MAIEAIVADTGPLIALARVDRLLYQAALALDEDARLKVVRAMYRLRFGDEPSMPRSVEQLRGIEGARVREMYKLLARQFGVGKTELLDDVREGTRPSLQCETANDLQAALGDVVYPTYARALRIATA